MLHGDGAPVGTVQCTTVETIEHSRYGNVLEYVQRLWPPDEDTIVTVDFQSGGHTVGNFLLRWPEVFYPVLVCVIFHPPRMEVPRTTSKLNHWN